MLWKICRYHLIASFPSPQPLLLGLYISGLQYGKILQFLSVQGEMAVEPLTMLVAVQHLVDISGILEFVSEIGKPKPRFPKFEYQTRIPKRKSITKSILGGHQSCSSLTKNVVSSWKLEVLLELRGSNHPITMISRNSSKPRFI